MVTVKVDFNSIRQLENRVDHIDIATTKVLHKAVVRFYSRMLQKGRDVWDTGNFFRSFIAPTRVNDGETITWKIQNTASYAWILWRGRRKIGNREYGSLKWEHGGKPMLEQLQKEIERELEHVSKTED
jgi:hypothetical protein